MKMRIRGLLVGSLLVGAAIPAQAQQGFALKGHFLYNSSAREGARDSIPAANGFSLGAEMVLPLGIGVGVSGYAAGGADRFFNDEGSSLVGLAEANYFLKLPLIPLAPYAGVHAGLGRITRRDTSELLRDRTLTQLGFQVGVRVQPISLLGFDAQFRRVSRSAAEGQSGSLERNQILVGITLF
jgi:hypothetical protein